MAGQAVLEPGDGVDVEVVGRLVEDQEVDAELTQRPGQRHPLGLAAGQRGRPARRGAVRCRGDRRPVDLPALGVAPAAMAARTVHPRGGDPGPAPRSARRGRAAPCRPRARPSRPGSRSSVDFPVPLSPTTPRRSPSDRVSDTSANSGRPGRLAATDRRRAGSRPHGRSGSAAHRHRGRTRLSPTEGSRSPRGGSRATRRTASERRGP